MLNKEKAHIWAKVTFLAPKEGGRKAPAFSGYRGQFFYNGMDCDAIHLFDSEEDVPFNTEVNDYIFLVNPAHHDKMFVGLIFLIREGPHTIGYGQVTEVRV